MMDTSTIFNPIQSNQTNMTSYLIITAIALTGGSIAIHGPVKGLLVAVQVATALGLIYLSLVIGGLAI